RLMSIRSVEGELRRLDPFQEVFDHLNHGKARAGFVCAHRITVPGFTRLSNSKRRIGVYLRCWRRQTDRCRPGRNRLWLRRLKSWRYALMRAWELCRAPALVAQWIEQRPSNP